MKVFKIIKKIRNRYSHIAREILTLKNLSGKYGHFLTIKKWSCIDKTNSEIPWYTYPAIEYLDNLDFSEKTIFEYGSGNSSLYWGKKAKKVISVEHNTDWASRICQHIQGKDELIVCNNSFEYEKQIGMISFKPDVVIVDGIRRTECARIIQNNINTESDDGFMIILDNSDWYKETAKYLREELDLIQVDFNGFGPINSYTWTTSVFLSRNYRFRPIGGVQPKGSLAGVSQNSESN